MDASPADGSTWAVVVAAGSGTRFGGAKQHVEVAGRRVLEWSLDAARAVCDGVVVVVAAADVGRPEPGADLVVVGGASRSESVRRGLAVVPDAADVVVVHDAARPVAGPDLFAAVVAAVRGGADAAVPGVAVVDSLRSRTGGAVDRDELVAVQTPQAFAAAALRSAHAGGAEASDDATLVERAGGTVAIVPGDPANRKLTRPDDLEALARSLAGRDTTVGGEVLMQVRVGLGVDLHPWSDDPERTLRLGGVDLPDSRGLTGHSDADAVAHACADALLGAAGLGDIGQHFPDTDPQWRGADSVGILAEATRRVREAGWEPGNVDCSVVLDAPRLAPVRRQMAATLSAAVGAPVTVTGRRTEGIGALGRGEGVVAFAVAVVTRATTPEEPPS